MNKTDCKLSSKIIDCLEDNGWRIGEITEQDGEYICSVYQASPLGEDFGVDIWFNGLSRNFVDRFQNCATEFDADEHAEMWIANRNSVRGVPQSIRALINDADAIQKMLDDTAIALSQLNLDDDGVLEED